MERAFAVTSISENSKVVSVLVFGSGRACASKLQPLLMYSPAGAVVNHVITGCQDQGRLLKEAKRDLEVFRKAYYKAEREAQDREARFELEKEALEDEIRRLRVRIFPPCPDGFRK